MEMADAVLAERPARATERSDHQLVSAARHGDDRAFEQLYSRYQRRIAAYVYGMVKDYGRAEDITQEVFVSALRRMRQTERPIAFKPWVYEIAKNACIDAYRRACRAEEVSYDADDRLSASDHGRLVATGPEPDAAVDAKQELDNLCGAFGGLSESHHEILVLRELEGLSYKEIGERMGMSRPAVESTLFRARKRLGEEYDELASGARCLRIQAIIADSGARLGLRDQRRLARHVSHCQPCRRLAAHAGLDVPVPVRRRIAEKVAGWLPLPAFLRFRRGDDEAASASGGGGAWMAHVPSLSESLSSGWGKAAAGLATLLAAGAGVGVTTYMEGSKRDERGTGYRATETRSASGSGAASAGELRRAADRPGAGSAAGENVRRGGGSAAGGSARGADGGSRAADGDRAGAPGSGGGSDGGGPLGLRTPELPGAKDAPKIDAPKLTVGTKPLHDTADSVADVAKPVTDATKPVTDATKPVTDATQPVTNGTKPVTDAAKPVTDAAQPVTEAAKPVTDAAEPVTDAAEPVTDAVGDATGGGLPVP
jgi:RNA polymerase sigma factor (sigma-70 family)